MVKAPVRVPIPVGVKVTLIMQLPPPLTTVPQLFVSEKSPLTTMLVIVRALAPVFWTLTGWGELEVCSVWFPKATLEGETETVGTAPVPVKLTVCGLPLALSAIVTAPVRVPTVLGVNVTLIVQVPPAPKLVPQLLVWA
jgi:hypothetical protein